MIAKKVVSEYMPPMNVNRLRKRGNMAGEKAFEDMMIELKEKGVESISTSQTSHRGHGRIGRIRGRRFKNTNNSNILDLSNYTNVAALTRARQAIISESGKRNRDIPFENFCLTLVHAGMYLDFHDAIHVGDSGRVERSLDMHTIFFFGSRHWKYARELLNLQVDRHTLWSDHMRGIWLNNILLNLSGVETKFMGIDEVNEYVVRELKDGYNPKGTIQSRSHLQENISPNVFGYMGVKQAIPKTFGIPWGRTSHSRVDDRRDIEMIIDLLLSEKVAKYDHNGRWLTGTQANPVEIKPSIDAFGEGMKSLSTGVPLANAVHQRLGSHGKVRASA